jgi:hypothetical protein
MYDFSVGTLLGVLTPDALTVQGMPSIDDLNFPADMGRMAQRLHSVGRTGSSQAACAQASVLRP